MRAWPWYSKLFLAIVLAALAWFVWPTPWRWTRLGPSPARIHRFTGDAQYLDTKGWHPAVSLEQRRRTDAALRDVERWERDLDQWTREVERELDAALAGRSRGGRHRLPPDEYLEGHHGKPPPSPASP